MANLTNALVQTGLPLDEGVTPEMPAKLLTTDQRPRAPNEQDEGPSRGRPQRHALTAALEDAEVEVELEWAESDGRRERLSPRLLVVSAPNRRVQSSFRHLRRHSSYRLCMSFENDRDPSTAPVVPILAASLAMAWRIVAFVRPSPWVEIPQPLHIPTALLGVGFLACGLLVRLRHSDALARAFFRYCIGAAVHWGGLPTASGALASALFLIYVGVSVLGDGALLDLAFQVRRPSAVQPRWRVARWLPYLPSILALALLPLSFVVSPESLAGPAIGLLGLGVLLTAVAAFVLLATWIGWTPAQRRARRFGASIVAIFGASLLSALGSAGALPPGGETAAGAWNLTLIAIPIALASALLRSRDDAACAERA